MKGRPATWKADSPFTGKSEISEGTKAEARREGEEWVGKAFELHVPVVIEGERIDYVLRFTATAVKLDRVTWA